MSSITDFDKAKEIKGYGSYEKGVSYKEIKKIKIVDSQLKVKPKVITTLSDYIRYIEKLESSYTNPIFYRGQTNANYLLKPASLRVNPKNEHLMIEAFCRKFYSEMNHCNSSMEKLMIMQHYQLPTRCLDVSENPLMALYFACSHMKKFRTRTIPLDEETWGEIILFREPQIEDKKPERLKTIESSNISIMANTAFMEDIFSLWHLGIRWKHDVDIGHDEKYIDLRSIISRSYIVRVPQTNARIKNQQGAFIMANANVVYDEEQEGINQELTETILAKDYYTYYDLYKDKLIENLSKKKTWLFKFQKIKPYEENEISKFKTDPFDLRRLFYKKNGSQRVILIPPEAKPKLLKELARLNITEDFVYPDMDNVANEISENINK